MVAITTGHETIRIPDPKIYKVEDVPRLMQVKRELASYGLKDPWLRNEVWKFQLQHIPLQSRIAGTLFSGFKYGLALAVLTVALDTVRKEFFSKDSHHSTDHH
uniref:NADH-dehydrogenase (Ubiquinone) 1 beta-subcomplex 3 n=1 Tax=Argas monolakensis TaxID=34602 RepID=Q09JJ9_ARGMO|nr:NADH-dehydrogenase (ubiquinone) 1 beta-subcomplex 3 [Argas monolakensis]